MRGPTSPAVQGSQRPVAGPTPSRPAPAPAAPPQATAGPTTPAQVYALAYRRAVQSGYSVQDAQAYAKQMMAQFHARQVAMQQKAAMPPAGPQQPGRPVTPAMTQRQLEQQRIQMIHRNAAAQQNAQLWQSLQMQRARQMQAAMGAPQRPVPGYNRPAAAYMGNTPVAGGRPVPQHQPAVPAQSLRDPAAQEQASVQAASLQVARQLKARESGSAVPPSTQSPPIGPTDADHSGSNIAAAIPAQIPQETVVPSVLENETLELNDPSETMGEPVPAELKWEMPTEVQQLPEESPNPLRRTPRRLPTVEPEPIPQPAAPQRQSPQPNGNEGLELEGFTGESVQPVSYQQTLEPGQFEYAGPLSSNSQPTTAIGEPLTGQTPEFYQQQLQTTPPQVSYPNQEPQPRKTFEVETEMVDELRQNDPLFQSGANARWQDQSAGQVQPPTGIRVQPASSRLRSAGRSRVPSYPMTGTQEQEELELGQQDTTEPLPAPRSVEDDIQTPGGYGKSCEQMREELLKRSIQTISLDLSTPLRNDTLDNRSPLPSRSWTNSNGQVLAQGTPVSATRYGINIIEESGITRTLPLADLSQRDREYATDLIDLPFECDLVASNMMNRSFTPTTVTWYASGLCHKPLYFEDIQLERYGHSKGPIRQPVRSAARFLGQAALLPYQVALHPPTECQYSLGLFRPGNCAPYLRSPFPWEKRAIGYETAALAGVFLLIP